MRRVLVVGILNTGIDLVYPFYPMVLASPLIGITVRTLHEDLIHELALCRLRELPVMSI